MTKACRASSMISLILALVVSGTHASWASGSGSKSKTKATATNAKRETASSKRRPASVPDSKQYSAQELFKRLKPAVAKIVIKQQNIPVSIGAGFFVSKDGVLLTNHHVMRSAISNPGFSVEFTLGDGTVVKDFTVANCGDPRNLDLCLLKLKVTPKSVFSLASAAPSPGEAIYAIGHPRNLDFSISNGIVSAVRKSPSGVDEVQISAAISPGNSGGPIFNSRGELVGVASKYLKDGQNLNFGILASEVARYLREHRSFYPVTEANKRIDARVRKEMKAKALDVLRPALANATQGKPIGGLKGFKEVQLDFGDVTLKTYLPDLFDNCAKANTEPDAIVHACFGMNENAVFSVQRFRLKDRGLLLKMNGKALLQPKALSIVEGMMQEGTWKEHEKKLTPTQRQSFFSRPSKAECQTLRNSPLPGAYFSASPACRFSVRGDTEPEALSVSVWLEKDAYLYGFNVWMNDPGLIEFFNQVPALAVLASKTEGKAPPVLKRTVASSHGNAGSGFYKINLPPGLVFSESKTRPDGSVYDVYVRRGLIGVPNDNYILVINRVDKGIQPTDFEKTARSLFEAMAESMKVRLKKDSLEGEIATLDGLPGRLTSGFGTLKGEEILVLNVLAFDSNRSYMMMQISDSKNPAQRFKDFKALYSSFKRK